ERFGIQRPAERDEPFVVVRIHDAQFTRSSAAPRSRLERACRPGSDCRVRGVRSGFGSFGLGLLLALFRALAALLRLTGGTPPMRLLVLRGGRPPRGLLRCAPTAAAHHAAFAAGLTRLVRVELMRGALLMSRF